MMIIRPILLATPDILAHFYLFSWVATKDSAAPEGGSEISIEKLETQLNTLKTMFAEKQKLVSDLEAYGPEGEHPKEISSQTLRQSVF